MAMVDDDLRVGSRTSHDGRPCTVRYIGTLASSSHEYLGVEWDDPSHGKHNGEHEGVRYFTCETSVRPDLSGSSDGPR